jgi:hypothetical protein
MRQLICSNSPANKPQGLCFSPSNAKRPLRGVFHLAEKGGFAYTRGTPLRSCPLAQAADALAGASLRIPRAQAAGLVLFSVKCQTPLAGRFSFGGERGIRTPVTIARKHAFQACDLNHSSISPEFVSTALREQFYREARIVPHGFYDRGSRRSAHLPSFGPG